jgi:replication-associated recombination protein RarA
MASLFTTYRPTEWSQLIGHSKLKLAIQRMTKRGSLGGRAFIISGASGIGKSTSAYLVAQDVCDPDNIVEINATVVTPKMVQDWAKTQGQLLIGSKPGRAIIINECHKMRTDCVTLLLEVLEDVKGHVVWIFTTQGHGKQMGLFDDDDSGALESRCVKFALKATDYRIHFAKHAMAIAEKEDLGGAVFQKYLDAADKTECNLRAMLSMVEAGEFLAGESNEVGMAELMELAGV